MWLIKTYKRNGTTHAKLTPSAYFLFVSNKNWRFFKNLINGGVGGGKSKGGGGWNFKKFVNISNEWKNTHGCLILMLNLKVSKQAKSEASKNKVIIKRISNLSIN